MIGYPFAQGESQIRVSKKLGSVSTNLREMGISPKPQLPDFEPYQAVIPTCLHSSLNFCV